MPTPPTQPTPPKCKVEIPVADADLQLCSTCSDFYASHYEARRQFKTESPLVPENIGDEGWTYWFFRGMRTAQCSSTFPSRALSRKRYRPAKVGEVQIPENIDFSEVDDDQLFLDDDAPVYLSALDHD